jgi:hypothetical protein
MLGKITPPAGIFEPAGSLRQVAKSFYGDLWPLGRCRSRPLVPLPWNGFGAEFLVLRQAQDEEFYSTALPVALILSPSKDEGGASTLNA